MDKALFRGGLFVPIPFSAAAGGKPRNRGAKFDEKNEEQREHEEN